MEAARFPIHKEGVGQHGLQEGRRGVHGAETAARIWGISTEEYLEKADPWSLHPNGELVLGVKIKDRYACNNVEESLSISGIAVGEGGPGDMALSMGYKKSSDPPVKEIEDRIFG